MLRLVKILLLLGGTLALGGFLYAWSGFYNIGASAGHWAATRWLLEFGMRNSVETRSMMTEVPPLDGEELVYRGLGHYAGACAPCHGAPGQPRNLVVRAMLPAPPYLPEHVGQWEPEELFWIVKHGIKYSGMPAWPAQQRDDEVWAVTAFLLRMPEMEAELFRRLAVDTAAAGDATAEPLIRPLAASGPVSQDLVNCARCHGRFGGGGGGAFPRLAGQKEEYLYAALKSYATGDRPSGIMGPIAAELSDGEMRHLAERYAEATDAAWPAAKASLDPAGLRVGAEIVRRGIPDQGVPPCASCHGQDGRGIDKYPFYPALAGQFASYLEQQLALWRQGIRGGGPFAPVMRVVGHRLDPDQARAVAAYLSMITPAALGGTTPTPPPQGSE